MNIFIKTSQVNISESIQSDLPLAAYEPQLNSLDEFLPVSTVIYHHSILCVIITHCMSP